MNARPMVPFLADPKTLVFLEVEAPWQNTRRSARSDEGQGHTVGVTQESCHGCIRVPVSTSLLAPSCDRTGGPPRILASYM